MKPPCYCSRVMNAAQVTCLVHHSLSGQASGYLADDVNLSPTVVDALFHVHTAVLLTESLVSLAACVEWSTIVLARGH